jgi:hypothetical protein
MVRGTKAEARGGIVRLALKRGHQAKFALAQPDGIADLNAQPLDQQRVHDDAGQPVRPGQRLRQRHIGRKSDLSHKRIGIIHRLHLRQAARALCRRHRPKIHDFRDARGILSHPCALVFIGKPIGQLDLRIAPQQARTFLRQPGGDAFAHRAHGGDCCHAHDHAGKEYAEPPQATAQFARGQPGSNGEIHAACSNRPSASRITRSQRSARSGAWVTSTSVAS